MINKTKTDCETNLCYYDTTRPRFFHGMLLTDEHLRDQQDYHREALKRANRNLWGSGIVCGLKVENLVVNQQPSLCIKVHPGAAIDCCGNLIEVCKCFTFDLSKECEKKFGSDCPPQPQAAGGKGFKITKYLVLRYAEKETDLEPVLTPDTDCDPAGGKSKCSASKVQEGFCIELADECPCQEEIPANEMGLMALLTRLATNDQHAAAGIGNQQGNPPQVPQGPALYPEEVGSIDLPMPCSCGCCESAVGLAKLTIDCESRAVEIDTKTCRRTIITPRFLSWMFSRIQLQHMSPEANYVYRKLPDPAVANLMMAGVAVETQGADSANLKKPIPQIKPKVNTTSRKTGRTILVKNP